METSISFLDRLRDRSNVAEWQRLDSMYRPFIRRYVLRDPTLAGEADDLVQDVLKVVCEKLPEFQRQREGSFRAWLRTITANRMKNHYRKRGTEKRILGVNQHQPGLLEQLAEEGSALARQWDAEHNQFICDRLLAFLAEETKFGTSSIEAFRRTVLEDLDDEQVARELGMTVNGVMLARSRILNRLRREGEGLLD